MYVPDRQKICVSFSGGRSSAVMTKKLLERYRDTHEIVVVFANTGLEHPETYNFIDRCDRDWGLDVIWLEYERGRNFSIVDYGSASRKGEPFERAILDYGIPNVMSPHCTRELKRRTVKRYLQSIGWMVGKNRTFCMAIGIRSDEVDRMSPPGDLGIFYPLVDEELTKEDVDRLMSEQSFDLRIPSDAYGNCVACWKKSARKLMTLALESPEYFDFFRRMEQDACYINASDKYGVNRAATSPDGKRKFFRNHQVVEDIMLSARTTEFKRFSDEEYGYDFRLDAESTCGQGCEIDSFEELQTDD